MDEIFDSSNSSVTSESYVMEQELVHNSEQQDNLQSLNVEMGRSEQRLTEKRPRQSDEEIVEDDEFVTVTRNHKRVNRNSSTSEHLNKDANTEIEKYITVCITGKEILPKLFGMA